MFINGLNTLIFEIFSVCRICRNSVDEKAVIDMRKVIQFF